jgi:hypothetical protein
MPLSLLLALGLVLVWIGERIVESQAMRAGLTGLGALLAVATIVVRLVKANGAQATRSSLHRTFAALHGLSLVALLFYVAQSDLFAKMSGAALESSSPKLSGALSVLWPALMAVSVLPTLFLELSFNSMAKSATLELGRLREAMYSGLGLAFSMIFVGSVMYVASERDVKVDLSYFRMAKPGEATTRLVASLDEPVNVYVFFQSVSDSGELVRSYFAELKRSTSLLTVHELDQALEPAKSKELGVTNNGSIVFQKGARKETLFISTELEKARPQLRGLDGEVQKRLLQVAKSKRTIYFTAGHGERTQEPLGRDSQRATIDLMVKALQDQNFEVRALSQAEGLGQDVPKDAAAVFIMSPQSAFTEPEARALEAYGKRGGRLFIALDPEAQLDWSELMRPLGLSFTPELLAQERGTANLRPPPSEADRINIGTRTFSSHPAVTYLGRSNAPVLLIGTGALDVLPQHAAELVVDFAVRSMPDAWNDANNNFAFDQAGKETKKAWGVVAAVTRRAASGKPEEELRALVLGDADGISDTVLPLVQGNQYLVLDGFKWLLGDEHLQGETVTELDVPLTRTRQQDSYWFYGTTFLAPVVVLGIGFLARRKPRKLLPEAKS